MHIVDSTPPAPEVTFSQVSPTSGAKHFYLFGTPISKSWSPLLHNTGFKHLGLNYEYHLHETNNVEDVLNKLREDGTMGGSVTIPFKQAVLEVMDYTSPAVEGIGAVNTVTRDEFGDLHSDNTDWIAIRNLITQASLRNVALGVGPKDGVLKKAVVLGAGGTSRAACYALQQLGIQILIWNRTPSNAEALAAQFEATVIPDFKNVDSNSIDVVVSTLPPGADCPLPETFVTSSTIAVDVTYHSQPSQLIARAKQVKGQTVEGIEMLLEQALYQFEKFVARVNLRQPLKAPAQVMAKALIEALGPQIQSDLPQSFVKYQN